MRVANEHASIALVNDISYSETIGVPSTSDMFEKRSVVTISAWVEE